MSKTSLTKIIANKEYRKKHNYMSEPGNTKMPEYDTDEVRDIEEKKLKDREIAKKYNRSIQGVSSKRYRIKHGTKGAYQKAKDKKAAYEAFILDKPRKKKELVITQESLEEADALLNGDLDIDAFLGLA